MKAFKKQKQLAKLALQKDLGVTKVYRGPDLDDNVNDLFRKYESAPAPRILPDLSKPKAPAARREPALGQRFYWAYGSNLSLRTMAARCPDARKFRRLILPRARLTFRGVADVVWHDDDSVPGGLWRITSRCEAALDRFEGVTFRHYVKRYLKIRIDGEVHDVLFYQMRRTAGIMPPSEAYLGIIADGYEDFGLDLGALDAAVRRSWNDKDVEPDMSRRHIAKGSPKLARDLVALPALEIEGD